MANAFWTEERTTALTAMADAGIAHKVIAEALGVTETAVDKKLFDLKRKKLGTQYIPQERVAPMQRASEEAVAALYAGQRYDDIILKPSRYGAKLWPHRHNVGSSLIGCGLELTSYHSGRRVHPTGKSAG